jgi:hypothetical protein
MVASSQIAHFLIKEETFPHSCGNFLVIALGNKF